MNRLCLSVFFIFLMLNNLTLQAWGFWAHQRINRLAVFTLPPEMFGLFKEQLVFLTEHAVDPDMRRYAVEGEAAHHYIDLDHYGEYPFSNMPKDWKTAVEHYSADTLEAYGVLPYHLPTVVYRLSDAFKEGNLSKILKLAADLGHYVGDAHVPLHTTVNYNGQMTGQKGIHGFWESRLPELFANEYDLFVGRAFYIENLQTEGWNTVMESHLAKDSVLGMEANLNNRFPSDKKYGYESRNQLVIRTYSREYSQAYHQMLDGMVERRMRKAVRAVGSYWYTAWIMAGSPDLQPLLGRSINRKRPQYERRLKILDRESDAIGFLLSPLSGYTHICCHRTKNETSLDTPFRLPKPLKKYRTGFLVRVLQWLSQKIE